MAWWRWWRVILRNWRTEKYTPGDALSPIGEKKLSRLLFSLFKSLLHIDSLERQYCSFFWENNIIHQGIRPDWWKSPQVFRLNLFRIAPTYGYSLCFQTAMSCIFLSFSLGDVCKKAIIQLEIFSNSKLSNLLTRNKSRIFEMSNQY